MNPSMTPDEQRIHDRRWWTLLVLCVSLLVIVMDNSILNVAIPKLADPRNLGAKNSELQWIVESYTLVFAGLLLTMGAFSDKFGRKTLLLIGFVLFGIGSIASAMATTPFQLTMTRAFMGIGGAAIMPATLSIITNVFRDHKERARAIGAWAGVAGLGSALGPITGGLLIEHFYWGSVFLINIPILLIGIVASMYLVPQSFDPTHPKMDVGGALLSIAGLGIFIWAIIEGPEKGWTSSTVVTWGSIGIVLLILFAVWEYKSDHPMLDISFFENPRFSAASAAITITFFVLFGALFGMTVYLQSVLGYSPLRAGVLFLPFSFTMAFVAPSSARIVEKIGTKKTVAMGLLFVAIALLLLTRIGVDTSVGRVILAFEVMAIGMGLTMAPATESIMGSLPRAKAGVGSAVNDTTRQVGGALGVAILGSILNSGYTHKIKEGLLNLSLPPEAVEAAKKSVQSALAVGEKLGGAAGAQVASVAQHSYTQALKPAFVSGSIMMVLGALIVLKFLPARGDHAPHLAADALDAEDAIYAPNELV